ncbi:hypothetical protein K4G93_23035, partial [Mycobacterium tuberculosis]|nr:hypothetical protein [Mycobacterium tuberculosis]
DLLALDLAPGRDFINGNRHFRLSACIHLHSLVRFGHTVSYTGSGLFKLVPLFFFSACFSFGIRYELLQDLELFFIQMDEHAKQNPC